MTREDVAAAEAAKHQLVAAVYGPEPNREGEYPTAFIVGQNCGAMGETLVVERIDYREDNFGDHGLGWFDVFADGKRVASLSARHVAEVRYLD